jgi:beta-phosphoglucomutase
VIRAVIFDFDGVIANSEPLHFAAFQGVLADEGVTLIEEEYYAKYLGYDDMGVFHAVSRDRGLSWNVELVTGLAARKAVRLDRLEQERSILFPGVERAIRRLAATLPLAIASGALRAEILGVLHHAGLSQYFGAIVAAEDTRVGKPAPDPYLRAVSLLGTAIGQPLAPGECVAVEDSHWGLESARTAGLRTIGITHTYPAVALVAAELVIGNLDALTVATVRRFDQV